GFVVDEKGTIDLSPKTKDGWKSVGNSAATLAELSNALMIPPRAPNAPEWNANALKVYTLAAAAMKAADRQDKESPMRIGAELDDACDGCHRRFVLGEK